jgi:hypothetical protein
MINQFFARSVVASAILCGTAMAVFAQEPDSLWVKTYGGPDIDRGKSMVLTADGGLAIAAEIGGYFEAGLFTNGDVWLVRTDPNGDTLWTKTYGGPNIDEANTVQQTSDGGYIIGGLLSANISFFYYPWLIRTDAGGDTLWTRNYGSTSTVGWVNSVQETSDAGFIFTGVVNSQITFSQDIWLVRTDTDGDTLWTKTFGGTGTDLGNSVRLTSDGGFIIAGSTREIGVNSDLWLIRTDEHGDTLWTRRYNGNSAFNSVDAGHDIQLLPDDGFMVLGNAGTNTWLLRTDMNGDTLWTKQYLGVSSTLSFQQTSDGGFIIAGGNGLRRTNEAGELLWTIMLDGIANSVVQTPDGGYVVAGYNVPDHALSDLWIFRLGSDNGTSIINNEYAVPAQFELLQNYPNPFNPVTTIIFSVSQTDNVHLVIFNSMGQAVRRLTAGTKSPGTYRIVWDGRNDAGQLLSSGTYFYRLQVGEEVQTRRMLLLK